MMMSGIQDSKLHILLVDYVSIVLVLVNDSNFQ